MKETDKCINYAALKEEILTARRSLNKLIDLDYCFHSKDILNISQQLNRLVNTWYKYCNQHI